MAKQLLPVIDSKGQFSLRRSTWVRNHQAARHGDFNDDGVFVFGATPKERPEMYGAPGNRAASLMDRLWDRQTDNREFPVDSSYWDGRACLRFWGDQSSHGGR